MNRNYTYTGPSGTFVIGDLVFVRDMPTSTDDATINYLRGTYPAHTWVLTGDDELVEEVVDRTPVRGPPLADALQAVSDAGVKGSKALETLSVVAEEEKVGDEKAE